MRQACILVGGRGSRLGTLTERIPKPMLSVAGRPFLDYLIANVARQGIEDILLLSGYQWSQVREQYDQRVVHGAKLRCIAEEEPRGTAGALWNVRKLLADLFFVLNGDTIFDINFLDLCVPEMGNSLARLALRAIPNADRHGRITLEGNQIVAFSEKLGGGPSLINAGVYYIRREMVERLASSILSLETEFFPPLAQNGSLQGRVYDRPFIDIGIPADLDRAQ